MKFSSDKQVYFRFGAGLLLLCFAAVYAYWNLDQSGRSAGWAEKAAIASEAVDEARITLDESKTGARMYLFEGNTNALRTCLTANGSFKNNLAEIRNFTLDSLYNHQTDTLQTFGDSVLSKLQYDVTHNQRGMPFQSLAAWDGIYNPLFQSISNLADRMDERETNLYSMQKIANEQQISSMRILGASSCLTGIMLIIIATLMMSANIRRRLKAQKELDYQKSLYDKFLRAQEDLNVGIAITEGNKVVFCNNALCEIIGYSKEELLGISSFFSLIVQEEILRLLAVMGTSQNSSLHNTFSAIRKDGNRVEIEYVSQIIANTNPPQTFSLIRDVTKQKREHEQLQESEVRLAEAQHIAHIGDWIMHLGDNINMDTNLVELSDENCRLLGLDPSAAPFTRADFLRIVHPDDRQAISYAVQRYIEGGPRYTMDFRLRFPGNIERIVHTEGDLVRDAQTGKPIALRGTMQDITERSHMTEQLKQYAAQMQNIMKNVDAGLISYDLTGTIQSQWSHGWEKIYGYPISDFQSVPLLWKKVIHPDDLPIIEASEKLLYAGETVSDEYRIIRKDGGVRWISSRMTPTKNKGGHVVRIDGIIVDVTEKKIYERYIADSLREKEYLLKELHHRGKNNMQVISSMLALQSDYLHDPGDKELFINSQNRVKAMAIVHEMLYQSPDLSTINISDYIHSLVEHLASMYADFADNITFDIQVENIMFDITVAKPCGLIINESVSNAIKYAFPANRKGSVTVILTADGDEANKYILTIRDDGVGLPPQFDWHNPTSLGLRLCVAFAQEMGGKLELIPGNGTQWRIIFRHRSKIPPQLGIS